MKIVVVWDMWNAVLLAQHKEEIGVDIMQGWIDTLNARESPIIDVDLFEYLAEKDLNLRADYVIISAPSIYD